MRSETSMALGSISGSLLVVATLERSPHGLNLTIQPQQLLGLPLELSMQSETIGSMTETTIRPCKRVGLIAHLSFKLWLIMLKKLLKASFPKMRLTML